jgi:hypothetical protein
MHPLAVLLPGHVVGLHQGVGGDDLVLAGIGGEGVDPAVVAGGENVTGQAVEPALGIPRVPFRPPDGAAFERVRIEDRETSVAAQKDPSVARRDIGVQAGWISFKIRHLRQDAILQICPPQLPVPGTIRLEIDHIPLRVEWVLVVVEPDIVPVARRGPQRHLPPGLRVGVGRFL